MSDKKFEPNDSRASSERSELTLLSQDTDIATAPPTREQTDRIRTTAAKSQGRLIRERFFRHKGALAGIALLALIFLLAFTSIGFAGIPGWWNKDYDVLAARFNEGKPTLTLWPFSLGEHPFGQDVLGRDYFALTMRGTQTSLIIAFIVGIVAMLIGTTVGALAGYFRGWTEAFLMRITDVVITIPTVVIAAAVAGIVAKAGIIPFAVFLGIVTWTGLARLVRGEFLSLREKEFVESAKSVGASSFRIIFRHILPNTVGVIIVSTTLAISGAILLETALSYLGLGVTAPDTSLGKAINDNRSALTVRPWLFLWPGAFIIGIALAVNFIGDGLRDAFDPKQTRVKQ
ncbi:ABC transporter permease [Arthrobacter agilis]|uniref:ABC transporter permease n=1 Tax=Arthrobacter agilis TaxID=37921 RepID=UPI000B355477|nr:ABC transporter permease [Arthrobacter agilis]OUM44052.1 ABC transporter permease [Arthrobacter agilis]PPB46429.1 ABC transporter permease [Arthrobacter agilis]TPV23916.1 ABC transporter permease [Arthrobacter agilis]VDR32662.1 Glutathione transport system permease protein gsiD [Arthrobacter agilis]